MLILSTTLKKLPVIAPGTGKLAELGDPIANPVNGKILGFTIGESGFFSRPHIISITDIIALDKRVVVINNPESIVPPKEVVRIKKTLDSKIKLVGNKARTESGVNLGRINDVLINTEPPMIVRYYIHHILRDRILPAEKVVRITRKAIIFSDDVAAIPADVEGAPA